MKFKILAFLATLAFSYSVNAITIGALPGRMASLSEAIDSASGQGNARAVDVDVAFPFLAPWTERGEVTDTLSGVLFSVVLGSGTWGPNASGTWMINDANFWTTYASVAIAMHVGNGRSKTIPNPPDHFIWLIKPGELNGTWSWDAGTTYNGGGLSNLKLFTSGKGSVPDSGTTLILLGAALAGLGFLRRRH